MGSNLDAAERLAVYLRENPETAVRSAYSLASEFGLSEPFVKSVIEALTVAPRKEVAEGPQKRGMTNPLPAIFKAVADAFRWATNRPVVANAITFAALISIVIIVSLINQQPNDGRITLAITGLLGVYFITTLGFHFLTFARHGNNQVVLKSGLMVWLVSSLSFMIAVWAQSTRSEDLREAGMTAIRMLGAALAMAVFAAVYTGLGLLAALVGKAVRVRREERKLDRLSRQELLDRLFKIRALLEANPELEDPESDGALARWVRRFQTWPYIFAVGGGLFFALLESFGQLGVQQIHMRSEVVQMIGATASILTFFLSVMYLIFMSYFSGSLWRSLAMVTIFAVSEIGLQLFVPEFQDLSIKFADPEFQFSLGASFVGGWFLAAMCYLASEVEERASRARRLSENEPAALIAEQIRIQWLLAPKTKTSFVVVVDAYRSSMMKMGADPFVAEWSFREYQAFIAKICRQCGGQVHSTAGDGAVLAFSSAAEAFLCARTIQTDIDGFNREVNRLDHPFRLRIGIHAGETTADINTVQFTDVIDIAAHIEKSAPVGGIVVSERVAQELDGERLASLSVPIDEQVVFLALNPTVGF